MTVGELFSKHSDEEFLRFDRIPVDQRRHPRPDLCAMLYLHERFGGEGDAVSSAHRDEIYLVWEPNGLTEEDVVYLLRCGVRYDDDVDSLAMFV